MQFQLAEDEFDDLQRPSATFERQRLRRPTTAPQKAARLPPLWEEDDDEEEEGEEDVISAIDALRSDLCNTIAAKGLTMPRGEEDSFSTPRTKVTVRTRDTTTESGHAFIGRRVGWGAEQPDHGSHEETKEAQGVKRVPQPRYIQDPAHGLVDPLQAQSAKRAPRPRSELSKRRSSLDAHSTFARNVRNPVCCCRRAI